MPPKKKSGKVKRKISVNLQTELFIIRLNEQGMTNNQIGNLLDMSRSTIGSIIKKKNVLAISNLGAHSKVIKISHSLIRDMEEDLMVWIQEQIKMNVNLETQIIMERAKSIFNKIKAQRGESVAKETFGATKDWFDNFKKRVNSSSKSTLYETNMKKTVSDENGIITYKWPQGEKEDKLNMIQRNTNSQLSHQPSCSNDAYISPSIMNDEIKVEKVSDDYNKIEEMLYDDYLPYLKEEEENSFEPESNTSNLPSKVQGTFQEKSRQNLEEQESINSKQQIKTKGTFQEISHIEYLKKTYDQHRLFGEFVAQELRDLRSEETRKKLKRKILKIIIEIEEEDD